jgi:8-oxo-dGTP diphosphatase
MSEEFTVSRVAVGAACAIFDDQGRVLLVHHTYGRLNWEIPGGLVEAGESPDEGALRELVEETGLVGSIVRLTGAYFEPAHDFGPMQHFVFRCNPDPTAEPRPTSPEISEVGYWPIERLPGPISDFTERRIRDALRDGPPAVGRIERRQWRD